MAAGSGSAVYPAPPAPPATQVTFLSVGEMVLSAAQRAEDPRGFWMQLYRVGAITQNELHSMATAYFAVHPAPPILPVESGSADRRLASRPPIQ